MTPGNCAQDEVEITGDMPLEPCPVLAFPPERSAAMAPAGSPRTPGFPAEDEEPTMVEPLRARPVPSRLYQFFFSPHHKTMLSMALHRYLREVRARVRQSREVHRRLYPDSGFQKIRRWIDRALRHARRNLAVK